MQFKPFVFDRIGQQIPVSIVPMTRNDAESTSLPPVWQTSWMSEYLAQERFEKYAAKVGGELIALGAYEILNGSLVVHIVYMEAQPESNPNLDEGIPKYTGIGRLMIAYGVKLTIDKEVGAVRLPMFDSSAPRYLIADEAAKRIFFTYLV